MTLDNWINLFLILGCFALGLKIYHEWVVADEGGRTCIKILGAIGSIIYVADLILSHIG